MQTNIELHRGDPAKGVPDTPLELQRARNIEVPAIVGAMQLFGIKKLSIEWNQLGMCVITSPKFLPMEFEPPEPIKYHRNRKVKRLCDDMAACGILSIEVSPSEDEKRIIQDNWKQLSAPPSPEEMGAPAPAAPAEETDAISPIQLNIETDPEDAEVTDVGTTE